MDHKAENLQRADLSGFPLRGFAAVAGAPAWIAVYILRHQIWPLGLIALMSLVVGSILTLITVALCIVVGMPSKQVPVVGVFFAIVSTVAVILGWAMWCGHFVERLPAGPV